MNQTLAEPHTEGNSQPLEVIFRHAQNILASENPIELIKLEEIYQELHESLKLVSTNSDRANAIKVLTLLKEKYSNTLGHNEEILSQISEHIVQMESTNNIK